MLLKRRSSLPPLQRPDAGSDSFGSVTNIISQPSTLQSERQEHRNSAACFSTPYTQYIVQCQWKNPALLCLCLWECVCVYLCLSHSLQAIQCYMKGSVCVFYDLPLQSQVSEVWAASDGGGDSGPFDMEDRQKCGNRAGFNNTHKHVTHTK